MPRIKRWFHCSQDLNRDPEFREFAKLVGYQTSTVRKKVFNREIDSVKVGRIVLIPESEVARLLSDFRPRVVVGADGTIK